MRFENSFQQLWKKVELLVPNQIPILIPDPEMSNLSPQLRYNGWYTATHYPSPEMEKCSFIRIYMNIQSKLSTC